MTVLLTGGTGFIGSRILEQLRSNGHDVVAVVRSDASAKAVEAAGATAVQHDLTDVAWLTEQLAGVEGAIHTAAPSDGPASEFDDAVLTAVEAAFGGTDKRFVHTGGIWSYGSSDDITEETPNNAPALTAWRHEREQRILNGDVDASVVVPSIVYGHGAGLPGLVVGAPRTESGAITAIGAGDQHWPTVHVDDLAALYVKVLEDGRTGATYIGATGVNPTAAELAQAAAGDGVDVVPEGEEATRERLGAAFADALFLDQQASGALAKSELGWNPTGPTLIEELVSGSYRA
ncbi:NAD-dependent epimerase/dehydratase family protein [Plantibacter sp. Mn2098]|uniref:NAD-dependent epimerase/dehydratase family protein n=1 Tax=Plantibacter sp. Mn2098 TaxID=3395266 RepID=UPI003BBC3CCF